MHRHREGTRPEAEKPKGRRPYSQPRLTDYGRLGDLTKGGKTGQLDNPISQSRAKSK